MINLVIFCHPGVQCLAQLEYLFYTRRAGFPGYLSSLHEGLLGALPLSCRITEAFLDFIDELLPGRQAFFIVFKPYRRGSLERESHIVKLAGSSPAIKPTHPLIGAEPCIDIFPSLSGEVWGLNVGLPWNTGSRWLVVVVAMRSHCWWQTRKSSTSANLHVLRLSGRCVVVRRGHRYLPQTLSPKLLRWGVFIQG